MGDSEYRVEAIVAAESDTLAARVGRATDEELAAGMSDPVARKTVLDQIFARMADHADPAQVADLDAIIHFKITGAPGGGADVYEAVFREGAIAVSDEPTTERPKLRITVAPVPFVKLVTGHESGPALLMHGKIKVWGNLALARRLPSLFRVPGAGEHLPT
jgi:putative sterol carrier protein